MKLVDVVNLHETIPTLVVSSYLVRNPHRSDRLKLSYDARCKGETL